MWFVSVSRVLRIWVGSCVRRVVHLNGSESYLSVECEQWVTGLCGMLHVC